MGLAPVIAAPGDTWGVSGPTFLKSYLTAVAVTIGMALLFRLLPPPVTRPESLDRITPIQAAYLNGGGKLAIYAAIAELRAAGGIGVAPRSHRLVALKSPPAAASDLARAVHAAVSTPIPVRKVRRDPGVRAVLKDLRDGLVRASLAIGPIQHRLARLATMALFVLLGLGFARLIAGLANGKPVGFLIISLLAVLLACFLLRRVPYRTWASGPLLNALRREFLHLAPEQSPAHETYGAASAAMGVALYGTAALWELDPMFAERAEIRRGALAATGGFFGGYSGTGATACGGGGDSGGGGGGGCGG